MNETVRARDLLWVAATASCLLGSGPEDGSSRKGSSAQSQDQLGPEISMKPQKIRAALWPDLRGQGYRAVDAEHIEATRALLEAAMRYAVGAGDGAPLPALAEHAGLHVERWRVGEHRYLALLESRDGRGTTGAFVLRLGPPTPGAERLLQAPHAYFDAGTGGLALQVLLADPTKFRGLFTNTLHRHVRGDGRKKRGKDSPADVCHNDAHPFVAATVGATGALDEVEVIQLHGFADDHAIPEAPGSWAIVSAGDRTGASPRVTEVAARLHEAFGVVISRFPDDVDALGATTNVIGRRMRAHPGASFLHVELSSTFRRELRRHAPWPARLARALARGDDRERDDPAP